MRRRRGASPTTATRCASSAPCRPRSALVDRRNRGVSRIPGADRLTWLHSLTTQHLTGLAPMTGTELLVLSPHGHVEHHALLVDDGTTTWLDVEPGAGAGLLGFLDRMRFLMRVEPADVTADWALLSLVGPPATKRWSARRRTAGAPDVLAVPGAKFADRFRAGPADDRVRGGRGCPTRRLGPPACVRRRPAGAPRDAWPSVVAELGVPWAGLWAYEALRVAARRPRLGLDTDHRTLPAEVGWMARRGAPGKGCYRGQETVARVHNLGRPPRRLVLLHLDGITTDELPAPGTPVTTADGRTVGFVGTAVRHHELGMIALALVKRNVGRRRRLIVGPSAAAIDPA